MKGLPAVAEAQVHEREGRKVRGRGRRLLIPWERRPDHALSPNRCFARLDALVKVTRSFQCGAIPDMASCLCCLCWYRATARWIGAFPEDQPGRLSPDQPSR